MRFGLHENYWAALFAVGVSATFMAGCGDDDSSGGGSTNCPDGQVLCDGECTDSDECEPATNTCPKGQVLCDDACATLKTDRDNCGECGNSCGAGESCNDGECVVSCPKGQVLCDGECINPDTSREYCGASGSCRGSKAGESCESGNVCEAGSCVASCSPGLTECNGGCVDLENDPDHCGACETSCDYANAAGVCVAGSCGGFVACTPGYADCDGREANGCEINIEEDRRHCGACDNRCALSDTCDDGECTRGTPGDDFRVTFGTQCSIVDHDSTTGDDRGGVAVTADAFYVTGDDATARISLDLKNQVALDRIIDGIVSDLRTGTLYEVGTDSSGYSPGDSTISAIHRLASDGSVDDTIALDTPISVSSSGNGVFAGPGFMVLYSASNGTTYSIDFATGAVTDLGDEVSLSLYGCENWASWGIAEVTGGTTYVVYSGSGGIYRTSLADGESERVLNGSFSDMCSLTFSPHQSRWYWHYEGGGQFGGTYETAGYCSAEWLSGDCIDTADLKTDETNCGACGNECAGNEQCNDGVCDACEVFGATECKGKCVDLQADAKNCGACGNKCGGDTPYCVQGTCGDASPSCKDVTGESGVYTLAPAGGTPFQAYCEQADMAGYGGGWTLLAVFSNADGDSWNPQGGAWVTSSTFGTPTDPTVNADAKSPAFNLLNVDELMIVQNGEVHVLTDTDCVGNQPLKDLFSRNSEDDADCAHECATVVQTGPWGGQDYQAPGLRFRCADYTEVLDEGGYTLSSDDNSFITTLDNDTSYYDYNFGLGAGEYNNYADWDSTTSDYADRSDTTQVLLYGR